MTVPVPAACIVAYLLGFRAGGGHALIGTESAVRLKGWAGEIRRNATDETVINLSRAFVQEVVGCRLDEALVMALLLQEAAQPSEEAA